MSAFDTRLCASVLENLQYQHNWTDLRSLGPESNASHLDHSPRYLISGLPPQRIYMHPDEQIEALEIERQTGQRPVETPEFEWVVPLHLDETVSIRKLVNIFDSINQNPRESGFSSNSPVGQGRDWTGSKRAKRVLLAVVHDDSTVVYYLAHDGIVKPRQN